MRAEFKPGVYVRIRPLKPYLRWPLGVISSRKPKGKRDWRAPGYSGEGFYFVDTLPDRREVIVHEDDLVLEVVHD